MSPPHPSKLTFDLLILKVVSESRVTWATSVPILVFLRLSVLDLGSMYAADRQYAHCWFRMLFLSIISTAYHLLSGSRAARLLLK